MKKIQIEVSLPEMEISEYEVKSAVKEQVKEFLGTVTKYARLITEAMREVIQEELKSNKKDIKQKVKQFISGMEGSTLYYDDGFRTLMRQVAKDNSNLINKRVVEQIHTMEYSKIVDAVGHRMADDFYSFIRNKE